MKKRYRNRLEKATVEFALAATAYALYPNREGERILMQRREEMIIEQMRHTVTCCNCLAKATAEAHNDLCTRKDFGN